MRPNHPACRAAVFVLMLPITLASSLARADDPKGQARPPWTASKIAGGTRVVFPAPVGARNTAQFPPRSAATICGKTSSIGSGASFMLLL